MSLYRSIYYSALLCGWLAFLGWVPTEISRLTGAIGTGGAGVVATCAIVGSAIGIGLSLASGLGQGSWTRTLTRLVPALLIGAAGGAAGGLIGDALNGALKGTVASDFAKALGWTIMGALIGIVDGVCDLSGRRIRNGLIGGILGGFAGGMLFDPIGRAIGEGAGMTSRAIGFTLLGLCIGALVGLVQVVFKDAWLTVLDGDRPGRQLILDRAQVSLGRAENAAMSFFGSASKDLEPTQFLIKRASDGAFSLEQVSQTAATQINGVPVATAIQLKDGDKIKFGGNILVFNERATRSKSATPDLASRAKKPAPQPPIGATSVPRTVPQPSAPRPPARPPVTVDPPIKPESLAKPPARPITTIAPPVPPAPPAKPLTRPPGTVATPAARPVSDVPKTVAPRTSPAAPVTAPQKPPPPPAPKPIPAAAPAPASADVPRCPSGHKVGKGERYCVICDLNF